MTASYHSTSGSVSFFSLPSDPPKIQNKHIHLFEPHHRYKKYAHRKYRNHSYHDLYKHFQTCTIKKLGNSRMQGAPVSNGRKESLWQDIYTQVRGLCDHNCSFQLRLCLHLQVCAIEYNCVFQVEHLDRCATIFVKCLFKNLQQLNHDPQEEDGAIGKDEVMESGIHSANLCTI